MAEISMNRLVRACEVACDKIYPRKDYKRQFKKGPFHCVSGVESAEFQRLADQDNVRKYGLAYEHDGGNVSICGDNTEVHAGMKGYVAIVLMDQLLKLGLDPLCGPVYHWVNFMVVFPNGDMKMVDHALFQRCPETKRELPIVVVELAFYNESHEKLRENVARIMEVASVKLVIGVSACIDDADNLYFKACIGYAGDIQDFDPLRGEECFSVPTSTLFQDVPELPSSMGEHFKYPLGAIVKYSKGALYSRDNKTSRFWSLVHLAQIAESRGNNRMLIHAHKNSHFTESLSASKYIILSVFC
ncbi:hypothetical protein SELMODRAFT_403525 [Selaginella moellendorffii]|uniref:Uncharacterized protein n=1 Tax=Selaginella moellendorffii TaxID=88036 RepID=D8QRP6_SELML|nr:hypothetical protein SELMODRAFT_403525 [Selaginella moellendorffii]